MTTGTFKPGLVLAFLAAGIALPLTVHFRYRARAHETGELLARQGEQLAQYLAENRHLSNAVVRADDSSLAAGQLAELLRLRAEVVRLREQTNALRELQAQNRQLQSAAPPRPYASIPEAERNERLSAETLQAMRGIAAALPSAMQKFADDHGGRPPPNNLAYLRYCFPTDGGRLPGLYTFEFAREEGPQPGDHLILRESASRLMPDGRLARVYGFSDGTATEVLMSTDSDLEAWEQAHLGTAQPRP